MAINRSLCATISENIAGVVVVRKYAEAQPVANGTISVSKSLILDVCFSTINQNLMAILSEDQSLSIWRIDDKLNSIKTFEKNLGQEAKLTRIRWNPYNINELICFSDQQVYILRNITPNFELLMPCPFPMGINEIFFIPKAQNRIFLFNKQLDFLAIPKKENRVKLMDFDVASKRIVPMNFGIELSSSGFVFQEDDKDMSTVIVDSKEFKKITFKFQDSALTKDITIAPFQNLLVPGYFIPHYNFKTGILYIVFPSSGYYFLLKSKKKKLSVIDHGMFAPPTPAITGLIGNANAEVSSLYLGNAKGICVINKLIAAAKPIESSVPTSAEKPKPPKEEEKKGKKKDKGKRKEVPSPFVPTPLPEERIDNKNMDIKAMIKKEIDEGIKTVVLPIIDAHMKQFTEGFQQLVAREVAMLKQSIENESIRMQTTGKFFENFMERMLDISTRFTGSLEKQMRDLALSAKPVPDIPPNPWSGYPMKVMEEPPKTLMDYPKMPMDQPRPPMDYSRMPMDQPRPPMDYSRMPMDQPRPPMDYSRMTIEQPMPGGYGYPSMSGYRGPAPQGKQP